jgi:hypothetical protein
VLTFLASLPGTKLNIFPRIERQSLLVLKAHQNLVHKILKLLLSYKSVGADTNRSPYIHLDLEQNRTGHDSFPKL